MRHRIIGNIKTGPGNPDAELMDNKGNLDKELVKGAIKLYFSKWGGFDFKIREDGTLIGIEPAYQYERLKVIFIGKKKENSYIEQGVAWGDYGSEIVSARKYYRDYKKKCKFVRFIDKFSSNQTQR